MLLCACFLLKVDILRFLQVVVYSYDECVLTVHVSARFHGIEHEIDHDQINWSEPMTILHFQSLLYIE